ncbi:hypothetical protein FHW83_000693 [Duganella sp. SG902]|nr:hypothetical protein [Duganella sp. SG902]
MDFVFIGAMALFFLLTVVMAAGCDKLAESGGQS